jgi:hypothetical protein
MLNDPKQAQIIHQIFNIKLKEKLANLNMVDLGLGKYYPNDEKE